MFRFSKHADVRGPPGPGCQDQKLICYFLFSHGKLLGA
jgi:hypothetical protein